jgi:hypothetical protein
MLVRSRGRQKQTSLISTNRWVFGGKVGGGGVERRGGKVGGKEAFGSSLLFIFYVLLHYRRVAELFYFV